MARGSRKREAIDTSGVSSKIDAINKVIGALEARYKDSTELFPDFGTVRQVEVVPSPSAIINAVTGVGGFPRGRVTEIYGPESSGKTTLAIEAMVQCQRRNPEALVLFVDYEHALDLTYARNLGLDLKPGRFLLSQPEYGEQGTEIIAAFCEADLVDLIVIDSAPAMIPRSELEGRLDEDGGTQKGTQAAMMARFLNKITKKIPRGRKPALVILNQTRAVINIGSPNAVNNLGQSMKAAPKEQAAGGKALRFYSSIRLSLEITRAEGDSGRGTKGTDQVYTQNRVRVTAVKNKLSPPWVRGQFNIEYGKGIDNLSSIAELAEAKLGIMSGAGFFKYEGDTPDTSFSCRGREAFLDYLKTSPELLAELERKIVELIKDEHAKALGIDKIQTKGRAKTIDTTNVLRLDEEDAEDFEGAGFDESELEDV